MAAVSRFGPPLALMGLIYFLSAQPGLSTDLGFLDLVLRKLAHIVLFGLLFVLWRRALPGQPPSVAAAIAIVYAITDELHQTTVEDRHGSAVDVLIDGVGIGVAWLTADRLTARRRG